MIVAAQIIGIVAVALYMLSFQLKKRQNIVFTVCLSNLLYVLQYILLGAFSGAALDGLSTVSSFFSAKKNSPKFKRFSKLTAYIMMGLILIVGVSISLIQKRWLELLPILGCLFQTGSLWFEDEQTIRKLSLAGAPFWLIYNFVSMAYGATIGSVLMIISAIIGLIRFRKNKKSTA